jgi:anaerobic ribonucleoside-triphosphate reductase activating protein
MSGSNTLFISETAPNVTTLGPGRRFVVWVQGCPFRCADCISPELQPFQGGREVEIDALVDEIVTSGNDGITFSGGEPFAQAAVLAKLIDAIRMRIDLSAMSYTGYTIETLQASPTEGHSALLNSLDLLVDGPYVAAQHANLLWRASRNQRLIALTPRHRHLLEETLDQSAGIQLEALPDGLRWIGVPPVPGFRSTFEEEARLCGIQVVRPEVSDE